MTTPRLSVLLVFGGESPEHEVSIKSAKNIYAVLDTQRYDVHLCFIARDGTRWTVAESLDALDGPVLLPDLGNKSFIADGQEIKIDVILPILHGSHGEDGDVQGLASLLHIPCVGPSLIGAAVSMDKDLTKRLLHDAGIPVVDWMKWHTSESAPIYGDVTARLGETVFVKPANAGSSVGVSKVTSEGEFAEALTLAAVHDSIVLIERAVVGREIELAALGNRDVQIATPGEVISESSFYSYDAKYAATSKAHVEIPASLSPAVTTQLKEYAEAAYKAVRGRGLARIDFFVTTDNEVFLNEINTIPGFTDISMYPMMWQHDGLSYGELVDRLIALAVK